MERDFTKMTKKDLAGLARQQGVKGYSNMSKDQLIEALSETPKKEKKAVATATKPTAKKPAKQAASATKKDADKPKTKAAAEERVADPKVTVAPSVEAETTVAETAVATLEPEVEKPAPQFKKTWINHDLLIDEALGELPASYGEDKVVLLVRDPFWMYAFWDLNPATVEAARAQGGDRLMLRVYDVTDLYFNGQNAHFHFDIPVPQMGIRGWYINAPSDGRTYMVDLGFLTYDGRFIMVRRSAPAEVPIARMSPNIADKFVTIPWSQPLEALGAEPTLPATVKGPDLSERMYQMSLKPGAPMRGGFWSGDMPKFSDVAPWEMGSHAVGSFSMPPSGVSRHKDFWLVADAELIVYGATEPDATVRMRGERIALRPDGSFSMRFSLPDGLHPIPIHAVNADEDMEKSITITVSRQTDARL